MILLFRDCNRPILEYYFKQGTTVTAASHIEIVKLKLKLAIHNKHRGLLSKVVLLLHNTCPHSTAATLK
jgi:hypothetical protein